MNKFLRLGLMLVGLMIATSILLSACYSAEPLPPTAINTSVPALTDETSWMRAAL